MNEDLKQKICAEYGLPTSFMNQPPGAIDDRMKTLLRILLDHPLREDDAACLLVKSGGKTRWQRLETPCTIGCHQDNTLHLVDEYISQYHCEISESENGWKIEDLDSTNGLYINKRKVKTKILRDGDMIQIGGILIIYMGEK